MVNNIYQWKFIKFLHFVKAAENEWRLAHTPTDIPVDIPATMVSVQGANTSERPSGCHLVS